MLQVALLAARRQPDRRRCLRRLAHARDPGVADDVVRRRAVRPDRCRRSRRGSRSGCWCRSCSRSCRSWTFAAIKPLLLIRGADARRSCAGRHARRRHAAARRAWLARRIDWLQIGGRDRGQRGARSRSRRGRRARGGPARRVSVGFAAVSAVLYVAAFGLVRARHAAGVRAVVPAAPRGHQPRAGPATRRA